MALINRARCILCSNTFFIFGSCFYGAEGLMNDQLCFRLCVLRHSFLLGWGGPASRLSSQQGRCSWRGAVGPLRNRIAWDIPTDTGFEILHSYSAVLDPKAKAILSPLHATKIFDHEPCFRF